MLCVELSASPPAGPERKRLASHGTLHQAANFSPSFSPRSPGAAGAAQAAPRGWLLRPDATAARPGPAQPRGRGCRGFRGPPGVGVGGSGPRVAAERLLTKKKKPLTTKASLFLKAPLAPIQEVEGARAPERGGGCGGGFPTRRGAGGGARPGPSPGQQRQGHAGARAPAARAARRLSPCLHGPGADGGMIRRAGAPERADPVG